jgi:hypothetical protein
MDEAAKNLKMDGAVRGRPFIKALGVTLLALLALRFLHQVPIPGLRPSGTLVGSGEIARTSIAAVAIQPWMSAVAIVQIAVLALPARWTAWISRGGFADPFGLVALALAAVFAYGQASGVVIALEASGFLPGGTGGRTVAVASLMGGVALVIGCAWLIDRFGLGHGFWVVFAASVVADLSAGWPQMINLLITAGPLHALAGWVWILAALALTSFITLLVLSRAGRFELVAWPLLLTALAVGAATPILHELIDPALGQSGSAWRAMPTVLTLAFAAAFTFAILRRSSLRALFAPIFGALAAIVLLETWGLSQPLWFPPVSALSVIALAALLTAFARDVWLGLR